MRSAENRTSAPDVLGAAVRAATAALAATAIIAVGVAGLGLIRGYRPVAVASDSMGASAPRGSLVIARPVPAVEVGDLLVMRGGDRVTVTHRVVELDTSDGGLTLATTKGDANAKADAAPHPVDGGELVGRWVVPHLGHLLVFLARPLVGSAVVGIVTVGAVLGALRRIWAGDHDPPVLDRRQEPTGPDGSSSLQDSKLTAPRPMNEVEVPHV
jgi:signal peptidase